MANEEAERVTWCELVGIEVENLRGFRHASLVLDRPLTLLVGPNNSGKTSLLRLLHWAVTVVDEDLLEGRRVLSADERAFLHPARETRGAARRLTLRVKIHDGRRARPYDCVDGVASLRLKVVGDGVFAATSRPRRSEPRQSEQKALELLDGLRSACRVVLIPAARDAASDRFRETLGLAVRLRLEERGLHQRRGGAPTEYRTIRKALEAIDGVADELVGSLWDDIKKSLVPGLADLGEISFDSSPQALVDWLVGQSTFAISTGKHDERMVEPGEVGAGLQSLLDLALLEAVQDVDEDVWLLVEEPEAFLHPSAQRSLATQLLRDRPARRIVSTHSPLIIDEARYGDVVLIRDHRVFEPSIVEHRRDDINTALLTQSGAEAIYSRSILFVEGPGDRAFFDTLRRRLSEVDTSGLTAGLGVVSVGGKARFGPWVSLLQSYSDTGTGGAPVSWLAVADSVDAASDLARGLTDGEVVVPIELRQHIASINQAFKAGDEIAGIEATERLNNAAAARRVPMAMLPVDLEFAMLTDASEPTIKQLCEDLGFPSIGRTELLQRLGSKSGRGPSSRPDKAEWIRARVAQRLPWSELTPCVRSILERWLLAGGHEANVNELLSRMQ